MKIFKSLFTTLLFSLGFIVLMARGIYSDDMMTTIILINGEAHLVDVAPDGELLVSYGTVPDYFTTSLSHEEILAQSIAKVESDRSDRLDRIRFVSFGVEKHMLNELAVDHVREISHKIAQSGAGKIILTVGITATKEALMKAQQVAELLKDFGVKSDHIQILQKQYLGDEPNNFIKMEYQPKSVLPY